MNTEFGFIGHCVDPAANHDKVWGYFLRPTPEAETSPWITVDYGWNCVIFYARRGKSIQFKPDKTGGELNTLVRSKVKKGYVKISPEKLLEIWPTFAEECEAKLMWDVLAGKVK